MSLPGTDSILEFPAKVTPAGGQMASRTPPLQSEMSQRKSRTSIFPFHSAQHSEDCKAHPGSWVSPYHQKLQQSLALVVLPSWRMHRALGPLGQTLVNLKVLWLTQARKHLLGEGISIIDIRNPAPIQMKPTFVSLLQRKRSFPLPKVSSLLLV